MNGKAIGAHEWRILITISLGIIFTFFVFFALIYMHQERNSAENFKKIFGISVPEKNDREAMAVAQELVNEKISVLRNNFVEALKEKITLEATYEFGSGIKGEIIDQMTTAQGKELQEMAKNTLGGLSLRVKEARKKELRAKAELKLATTLAKKYGLQIQ